MHLSALFNGAHHILAGFFPEAFHLPDFLRMLGKMVDILKFFQKSLVHKFQHGLNGKAVDIHSRLAHKPGKFLHMLCAAVRIGAVKGSGFAFRACADFRLRAADRALFGYSKSTGSFFYRNTLGNNFIGLNHLQRAGFPDSQPFHLADIAERRPGYGGSLKLDGRKYGHRRYCGRRAGPFHI